jgi:hypothetical protein
MTPYQRLDERIKEVEAQNRFLTKFVLVTPFLMLLIAVLIVVHN